MVAEGFAHLGDREVHQGHIWHVVVASYRSPDGTEFTRDLVRSPGAVAVVPLLFDAEGTASVVLVEQYRPALDQLVIEIPAGMRDVVDEAPETTAHRELGEEAGLAAGRLEHLIEVFPSPGMTDSVTSIYLATECTAVPQDLQGPEEEHLRLLHLPFAEAIEMIAQGHIRDAKTVIGLTVAHRRLE
jgi:nudix-type nucleoside diphosphatase (YffH/AdpP family)